MAGVIKTVTPYNRGAGHYCVGQLNYERANEEITLAIQAAPIVAGTMLGIITAGGNYTTLAVGASDGSQNFAGILWDDRPISAAVQRAVATKREATVNCHALVGFDALTTNQKATIVAAAKTMGIIILT